MAGNYQVIFAYADRCKPVGFSVNSVLGRAVWFHVGQGWGRVSAVYFRIWGTSILILLWEIRTWPLDPGNGVSHTEEASKAVENDDEEYLLY